MELWIRSRNKNILIKADFIYIEPVSIKEKDGCYIKTKHGINNGYSDYTLGHYKTKERALEVLDEIQKLINNDGYIDEEVYNQSTGCYHQKNIKVYEMPQE